MDNEKQILLIKKKKISTNTNLSNNYGLKQMFFCLSPSAPVAHSRAHLSKIIIWFISG